MGYVVENIAFRDERDRLGELFQNINADMVIVIRGDGIPPGLIDSLSCPTVLWYGEYLHGNDEASLARQCELRHNAAVFDYAILFGEEEPEPMQVLRNLGCNRVECVYPHRFDPTIYRKLDLPKLYDVSFVGTLTPRRKQILETLTKRFNVEFRNIWNVEEQVHFYNQSKIVLHINAYPFILMASPNIRTFDVVGSGTFMITEDQVFHQQLKDREHLVYWRFNDVGDLTDKIEYYLAHEEERKQIAAAGYRYVCENFSTEKSIHDLLNEIDCSLPARAVRGEGFGVAFDKWGRQTFSMNELEKAVELGTSPSYAHSYYERGKIYFQIKRWEKAAEVLEQALEIYGHFIDAMYLLALSYQRLQRWRDAVRELRLLLQLEPFHAEANIALGKLYPALGDAERGEYYEQRGLKLAPKQTTCRASQE
jgi:tetratricopeptide (TPR) repeat protein